jgi:starvation-inducible DNA-binding protein
MEKLYKKISDTQATLFVLFQKTWVYHWNVVGPDFYQFHKLFGEHYEEMFVEIDRLTEHMRYLNIKPVPTLTRLIEVSHILEANSNLDAKGMVNDLLSDTQTLISLYGEASDEADKQNQKGTCNVLDDLSESAGKRVWMLRSFLTENK